MSRPKMKGRESLKTKSKFQNQKTERKKNHVESLVGPNPTSVYKNAGGLPRLSYHNKRVAREATSSAGSVGAPTAVYITSVLLG